MEFRSDGEKRFVHGPINRRDFLKLAGIFSAGFSAPGLAESLERLQRNEGASNLLIIVFDALSARNIGLYGYTRNTMPNLARWTERAVIYHKHHAGGNFTAPGTASLLTSTLPWTHRAFNHGGKVDGNYLDRSLFSALKDHYRFAYSHNPMANGILQQFAGVMDDLIPRSKLFIKDDSRIPTTLFGQDDDIATVSWLRALKGREEGYAYSLFVAHLLYEIEELQEKKVVDLQSQFPSGLPRVFTDSYYMLEDAVEWFGNHISGIPTPFAGYLHFMPPHAPYKTHREFYGNYSDDGVRPEEKPVDLFSQTKDFERTLQRRAEYDEFIRYVDRELDKFLSRLDDIGMLDETWVIITSDHGEMFERGVIGHKTPLLYEPVVHIPLMILEPGRTERLDIQEPTSAVDLLPTLLHVVGQEPANWSEGMVLPPYSNQSQGEERNIYVMEAKKNAKYAPLKTATVALIKGGYKLMNVFGYSDLGGEERVELFDLRNDPEELVDLYSVKRETAQEMLNELKGKLAEVNEPYL